MMLQHPQFPEDHSTAAMALAPTDMTLLEWQKARLKWLQQRQHPSYFTAGAPTTADLRPNPFFALPASTAAFHTCSSAFGDEKGSVAHDLSSNMSPDLIHYPMFGGCFVGGGEGSIHEAGGRSLLRTFSCLPVMGDEQRKATPSAAASPFDKGHGASLAAAAAQHPTEGGRESSRKRKAAYEVGFQEPDSCYIDALVEPKLETPSISSTTVNTTADGKDHKPTSNKEASSYTSKDKCSKVSDPSPKTDYIHVRARRGQATDNHSLAERARREKISKRMKLLQELVPGCSKITGKAGVLDEIINYVQSLQRQVEFLSMKLAAVNPTLDSNIDALLMSKEMSPHHRGGMVPSSVGTDLPSEPLDASFLNHVNTMKAQLAAAAAMAVECSGALEVAVSSSCPDEQASLFHRTPRAPVLSASECCSAMDPYEVHGQVPTYPWEADWQSHYSVYELQQLGLGVGAAP